MPDVAAGDRAEGETVEQPPKPGEDRGLRPGERAPEVDTITRQILTRKRIILLHLFGAIVIIFRRWL